MLVYYIIITYICIYNIKEYKKNYYEYRNKY